MFEPLAQHFTYSVTKDNEVYSDITDCAIGKLNVEGDKPPHHSQIEYYNLDNIEWLKKKLIMYLREMNEITKYVNTIVEADIEYCNDEFTSDDNYGFELDLTRIGKNFGFDFKMQRLNELNRYCNYICIIIKQKRFDIFQREYIALVKQ